MSYESRLERLEQQFVPDRWVVYAFDSSARPAARVTINGQAFERDVAEDAKHFQKRVRAALGVAGQGITLVPLHPRGLHPYL